MSFVSWPLPIIRILRVLSLSLGIKKIFVYFLELYHFLELIVDVGTLDFGFVCSQALIYESKTFLYDLFWSGTVMSSFK